MLATFLMQGASLEDLAGRASRLVTEAANGALALLLALAVLLAGWLLARLVARLVAALLRWARFDALVRRLRGTPADPPRLEPGTLAVAVVYWSVVALAAILAADALGLDLGSTVGERLRDVLPRVVAATIELVAGIAVAMVLGAVTRRMFAGAGLRGSRLRGQVVTAVIGAFAVLLALEQLGLAAEFIVALGITAMAAVGLALALAFGLGCRELARDFIIEYLRSLGHDDSTRTPR